MNAQFWGAMFEPKNTEELTFLGASLTYRHEQTSEERDYRSAMDDFMSDLTIRDEGGSLNQNQGSIENGNQLICKQRRLF
jgi:hypothetical protein